MVLGKYIRQGTGRVGVPVGRWWSRATVACVVCTAGLAAMLGAPASGAASGTQVQYSSAASIRSQGAGQTSAPSATAPSDAFASGTLVSKGGPYLVDRFGRTVTLHGVNAVYKYAPFELYPDPGQPWNFDSADAQQIAALGFNVVRLGILWEGIEPGKLGPNDPSICTPGTPGAPSQFNSTTADAYLAELTKTVDLLGKYHVYVLLDMHQDVYSQPFRGEGAPAWAICTDGQPIVPSGGRWSTNYGNPTLEIAEAHFWSNDVVGNLQGAYDQSWAVVAKHFANNPWVVGYDPYNEPSSRDLTPGGPTTFAVQLECFYTGRAHPGSLTIGGGPVTCPAGDPLQGVVPTIESADPHHLVFIEPDNFSVRNELPSLLGTMDFPRLVYNFHAYCGNRSPVTGDPYDPTACSDQVLRNMGFRFQDRPKMASSDQPGGPAWFMSEFGATSNVEFLDQATDNAGTFDLGWIYWSWKYYNDPTGSSDEALALANGQLAPSAAALSQPFAPAIAGTFLSATFQQSGGVYQLVYRPSSQIQAPTSVFTAAAEQYPNGYCSSVTGGSIVSPAGAAHLLIKADRQTNRIVVTIKAGSCNAPTPPPAPTSPLSTTSTTGSPTTSTSTTNAP